MVTEGGLSRVRGTVKWFDTNRGFGFVVTDMGGPDILLHVNALRNFGQSSVTDRARIVLTVQETARGFQAVEVLEIFPAEDAPPDRPDADSVGFGSEIMTLPLEPARVKWFDKGKGFGFANVFGRPEDVFVHMEVLRRSGFADLQPGEGVGMRIADGERGRMAVMITAWDAVLKTERQNDL